MRIKKLAAAALTGVMVLAMGTSVYAASSSTITGAGGSTDPQNVTATYQTNGAAGTVHSVDIAWGDLQYTYTVESEGTWNPKLHSYVGGSASGAWTCTTGANEIKVTNHSNTAVKAVFTYNQAAGYESISGTFDKAEATLANAEGTAFDNAPADTATLSLNGALNKNVPAATTVGTVTVSLGTIQ